MAEPNAGDVLDKIELDVDTTDALVSRQHGEGGNGWPTDPMVDVHGNKIKN